MGRGSRLWDQTDRSSVRKLCDFGKVAGPL